ncbi:TPA: hypothetical protein ACH5MF_004913, partial [Escherichia coli]
TAFLDTEKLPFFSKECTHFYVRGVEIPLPRFGCSFLVALLLRYASAKAAASGSCSFKDDFIA